jgi:hypothetical protein
MLFLGPKLQVKDVLHTGWVQQTAGCENGCNLLQHFQNQALNPPGTVIYDHLCVCLIICWIYQAFLLLFFGNPDQ